VLSLIGPQRRDACWWLAVAFGDQRTCAAEARGPHSTRMTQVGSRASQFAVMQNALPIFDVVGYDPRLEGSHEVTIAAVNTALFKRLLRKSPRPTKGRP
jgi:hypothetical protein